jgi:hypothetical protein
MMDVDNGKVLQSLPISGGVDANIFEAEKQACSTPLPSTASSTFFRGFSREAHGSEDCCNRVWSKDDGLRSEEA